MTETKTAMLSPAEWQALCAGKSQQLANFCNGTATLSAEQFEAVAEHLDRLRTFVSAWKAASPQPVADPNSAQNLLHDLHERQEKANGAVPPVKPKRKYTRRVKPEAVATQ